MPVLYITTHCVTSGQLPTAGATSDASREIINSRGEVHFRVDEILLPALCVNVFDPSQALEVDDSMMPRSASAYCADRRPLVSRMLCVQHTEVLNTTEFCCASSRETLK